MKATLVTRNFQIWLGDGQRGRAAIEYDLSHDPPAVQVVDNPSGLPVRVDRRSPLAALPQWVETEIPIGGQRLSGYEESHHEDTGDIAGRGCMKCRGEDVGNE